MIKDTPIIFEKSIPGRVGASLPMLDVPETSLNSVFPSHLLRTSEPDLPEVPEPEVVRHYTNLSVKNHHVDRDLYPLGSCTMKYNPKINDALAGLCGFAGLHPLQSDESSHGALRIVWELEQALLRMTGMSRATLQPSAGAQGEFVGALLMSRYHEMKQQKRRYILIPETAHGTNPATVKLAGFETCVVKSDSRGRVDLEDLKTKVNDETAGMMLTQPNTLGLFEDRIQDITRIVHERDGIMYMDGANLNALVGVAKPADMGFDITHINLHKTFSTPHGGGGPGSGPIAVVEKLVPYLPAPMIEERPDSRLFWNYDIPDSIGPIHSFFGNFGILVRAWAYIKTMGESGLRGMTKNAILNANYLKARISEKYDVPYTEGTMHEFVISGEKQKKQGTRVLDIAKMLLDHGFHAPTVYFPLLIPEAMMMEPTETESMETLDRFADSLLDIDRMVKDQPELLETAPLNTPVQRLDETLANRNPDLKWEADKV